MLINLLELVSLLGLWSISLKNKIKHINVNIIIMICAYNVYQIRKVDRIGPKKIKKSKITNVLHF